MHARHLIILAGPTSVGKTTMAIQLARHLGTEIINADSRQVYREMRIGTGMPSVIQLAEVTHHLVAHKSIHEHYNAGLFEQEALAVTGALFKQYHSLILTGGSGLYIDAVCHGIDDIPPVDPEVRNKLVQDYLTFGLDGIRTRLRESDPDYYYKADLDNPKRILKALEIIEMTGKPYSAFLTGRTKPRQFNSIRISLDMPRNELHERINLRVDDMMSAGLLDEVRALYPHRHLNALNTVGYKELFGYIDKRYSLDEAVEKIKGHTRQYARRQLTWFRRDKGYLWYGPDDKDVILGHIHQIMKHGI